MRFDSKPEPEIIYSVSKFGKRKKGKKKQNTNDAHGSSSKNVLCFWSLPPPRKQDLQNNFVSL